MKPSLSLTKMLKPPSQIANSLDWTKKGNVATLHIGIKSIGVAIASHPEMGEAVTQTTVPLHLETQKGNQRVLSAPCVEHLEKVCREHQVESFVVLWPIQSEGRAGASCGKVLHTLESLITESDSFLTKNRPLCLWADNSASCKEEFARYTEDDWGRCAAYALLPDSNKTIHRASQEQYRFKQGSSSFAAQAWEEFCLELWPQIPLRRHLKAIELTPSMKLSKKPALALAFLSEEMQEWIQAA